MVHEYKLDIQIEETGETISLSGQFGDEEWNLLEEFVTCEEELEKTKFVQNGMPSSLKMESDDQGNVRVSVKLPPWEDAQAFLHVFRPILLQSEATNFYKICNILSKELNHPYFRGLVAFQREIYSGKRFQEQVILKSEEVILNSEKVLHDWLNSYEYHRDKDKRKFIDSLHALLPLEASKVIFLSLLTDRMQAVYNLALIVRVMLGKQKSVTGPLRRPSND